MPIIGKTPILAVLFFSVYLSCLSASAQSGLRAAVAKADITPKTHEVLWGFEERLAPATTTPDPFYRRILVLGDCLKRLAIVTLDLGRSFGEASLDRLQEQVQKSRAISCLLVSASH